MPGLVDELDDELSSSFPFKKLISLAPDDESGTKLQDDEIRLLAGNGFHWAQIGSFLMFAWGTSRLADEVPSSSSGLHEVACQSQH